MSQGDETFFLCVGQPQRQTLVAYRRLSRSGVSISTARSSEVILTEEPANIVFRSIDLLAILQALYTTLELEAIGV